MKASSAPHESPLRIGDRNLDVMKPRVRDWLLANLAEAKSVVDVRIATPSSAGVANETLFVSTVTSHGDGPRYVFRLQGEEHLYPNADITFHARVTCEVGRRSAVPVPRIFGIEDDPSIIGSRFMVMDWVEGRVPPDVPNYHRAGWLKDLPPAEQEGIWRDCVEKMAALHAMDPANFEFLKEMAITTGQRPDQGRSGLQAVLQYWDNYAVWCGANQTEIIEYARNWLWSNAPRDRPDAFSWGDARLPNTIVRDGVCVAILDWDMVSLAGPEADLAWWALADHKHTVTQGIDRLPGIGSPAETIRLWELFSGRPVRDLDWFLVFTAYRQALITFRLFSLSYTGDALEPDFLTAPGIGFQWLASLLDLELPGPLTMPFLSLEL
ncbi:MAG: phosphotransferase family protein [Novosphingobium sp.]|nr:phosphotransferase family protein [Novosphingobium sp.]MCP5403623.1 phosphotransferase family protein [Novosphingobium sp.]